VQACIFPSFENYFGRRKLNPLARLLLIAKVICSANVAQCKRKGRWATLKAFVRFVAKPRLSSNLLQILTNPKMMPLVTQRPNLIYKWNSRYIGRNFARNQRARILAFHYGLTENLVHPTFYNQLLTKHFVLWEHSANGQLAISLRYPKPGVDHEGDLALVLEKAGTIVYELSFTFIHGSLVTLDVGEIMFIARIQGRKDEFHKIREATRLCRDVAPPHLLMAAAEGLAKAIGVKFIAGIRTDNRVSSSKSFNYEAFWETFIRADESPDYYLISVPIPTKPLDQCNPDHRRRTRKKRDFKAGVAETVRNAFINQCLDASHVFPEACAD
jgi:uncharacterized protein VirK/YbjX